MVIELEARERAADVRERQAESWAALDKLVRGRAELEIKKGDEFLCDGARLYPDEVSDLLLPSMLCLADSLTRYMGMGGSGYEYRLDNEAGGAFPLVASAPSGVVPFHRVAPFVDYVFDVYVLENRAEVARVIEIAVKTMDDSFSLERNTRMGDEADATPRPR